MRNDGTLKMMMDSREKELPTKQEGGIGPIGDDPTSSRVWPGLKNPRIVRVSRAFGGKDRHSKVTTIRGLRDRRVRLSVPTAIQLYDLQDRLGLNQPSKVVDWLLSATQHEIDKLPPLQIPSGNFIPFSQSFAINHEAIQPPSSSRPSSFKNTGYTSEDRPRPSNKGNDENMSDAVIIEDLAKFPRGTYWNSGASQRTEQSEPSREPRTEKCMNIMKGNEVDDEYVSIRQASAHDPRHPSIFGTPCNSYYHSWESLNAYTSNLGVEAPPTLISSSLSLAPGPQLVLYPSGAMPPSMLSSYITASTDFDTRQLVSSTSQNLPSNHNIRTYLNSGRPTMISFHSNLDSAHHHSEQDCNES